MTYLSFRHRSDYLICIVYILPLSLCKGGREQTLVVPTYIEVPGLNNLLVCPDLYFRIICDPGNHGHFWVLLFWQINMNLKWSPHAKLEGLNNLLVLSWLLLQDHLWAWPPLMSWFMMSSLLYNILGLIPHNFPAGLRDNKSFLYNRKRIQNSVGSFSKLGLERI